MPAFGYSLIAINDIAIDSQITNLVADQGGRVLTEPSLVTIAVNGEDVDISIGIRIGTTEVLRAGSRVTLQATVGVLPIMPDDVIAQVIGVKDDEIIVSARNADAAAAREVRTIILVTPLSDLAAQKAIQPVRVL